MPKYFYKTKYASPFLIKKIQVLEEDVRKYGLSADKYKDLYASVINVNYVDSNGNVTKTIPFDADEVSMDRIDRIVEQANYTMLQRIANGESPSTVYDEIFKQTFIPWKCADGVMRSVSVETLAYIQRYALENMKSIWQKYTDTNAIVSDEKVTIDSNTKLTVDYDYSKIEIEE